MDVAYNKEILQVSLVLVTHSSTDLLAMSLTLCSFLDLPRLFESSAEHIRLLVELFKVLHLVERQWQWLCERQQRD